MISWSESQKKMKRRRRRRRRRRGRPYVYSPIVILRCFIVRLWFRLDSNNELHEFLELDYPYNEKIMKACGLTQIPDRRTFDRRLKTISTDIKERISSMGNLFVNERLVDPYIVAIDSTLLKAKGHLWHKSSMDKGIVPRSGIDTNARWGFSHNKGWIFGYKLHLISSTGSLIVPLAADFTTANVQDNQMYNPMLSSSLSPETYSMIGDSGYDDHKLYDLSTKRGFELVCPVQRYKNTPNNRLELIQFYESELGQAIYSWRSKSIEPLIEHIKSVFRIDPLPVRGYNKSAGIVLLSVLLYQILVYYNYKTRRSQRPKSIKHMLCS
ncbi:MAG TPA: transposase [Nitrososphaeraceae archaeon]|nr:transposase [Nitrososphaeraceae archaeon]